MRIVSLFGLQFLIFSVVAAQNYSELLAMADTANFSTAKHSDWQLLNSYVEVNKAKDSVVLELVVLNKQKDINWKKEQYLGRIKKNIFFSKKERLAYCSLLDAIYKLTINGNGECYLRLEKGYPPADTPVVIPLKVTYIL